MKLFKSFAISFLVSVVLFGVGHSAAFAADPVITSISPTSAKVGDTVTITGTNFPASSLIHIVSPGITPMDVKPTTATPSTATFIIPFGWATVAGDAKVTIGPDPAWSGYLLPVSNEISLTILATTPTITSVSPTTAKVGDMVTVTGSGFNYAQRLFAYYKVSTLPQRLTLEVGAAMTSPTSMTFKMPSGLKGPITVFFSTPTSIPSPASNEVAMTVIPTAPILTSLEPLKARKGVATSFLVVASNYDVDAVFTIDNNPAYSFGWTRRACGGGNGDNITCITIPSNISTGPHSFQLKETDSGLTSNSIQVEIIDGPSIDSVDAPYWNWYSIGGYTPDSTIHLRIHIRGTGFDTKTAAYLDGGSAPLAHTQGGGLLDFDLPNTLVPGSTHTIQVKQSDSGAVSNIASFTVPQKPVTAPTPTPTPTPNPTPNCQTDNCSVSPIPTLTPTTPTPTQTSSNAALQQQLVQLITLLLQLVQKAATQGLLTSSQVLSILSSIQIPH